MLHALTLIAAIVVGPEQFAGAPARQPVLSSNRVLIAPGHRDLGVAVIALRSWSMFRVTPDAPPAHGARFPNELFTLRDLAANGRGYAAAWTHGAQVGIAVMQDDGSVTTSVLATEDADVHVAALAGDGRNYLVAWGRRGDLRCQLVDARGIAIGPVQSVNLGSSIYPPELLDIASNGSGFVVFAGAPYILSIFVSPSGAMSRPVPLPTPASRDGLIAPLNDGYLVVVHTGTTSVTRLDARGLPQGPVTFHRIDLRNPVPHRETVVFESAGRLYSIDADARLAPLPATLPPQIALQRTWFVASDGVELFALGGDAGDDARIRRLGTTDPGTPIGLAYADQDDPQVVTASGTHAVAWREVRPWAFTRVRDGVSLDTRVELPAPARLASDGRRNLLAFVGETAHSIPLTGPLPLLHGSGGAPTLATWTGSNFAAVWEEPGAPSCGGPSTRLAAATVSAGGVPQQPRTLLGIDGHFVSLSAGGLGDGFVVSYRLFDWIGDIRSCSAKFIQRAPAYDPNLAPRGEAYAARVLAGDDAGTLLLVDGDGVFAQGRITGKLFALGDIHAAWTGRDYILARQREREIELARWDPAARPFVASWFDLRPEVLVVDATLRLDGIASSTNGAVLFYTRADRVDGFGWWRRIVLRELDVRARRRAAVAVLGH